MMLPPSAGLAACPALAGADLNPSCTWSEASWLAREAAARLVVRPIAATFVGHAWAPPGHDSKTDPRKCPVGFGATARDPYTYKTYPVPQLMSILGTYGPWNIIKVYLKNLGLVGLLTANLWLWEALEAEEKALQANQPPETPPLPDLDPLVRKAAWNTWRELLTTSVRRVYEHIVAARCSPRWAWKTLKDYPSSVNRKAAFFHLRTPWYNRIPFYTTTISRCTVLLYGAEWTVSCAYDIVDLGRAVRRQQRQLEVAARQLLVRVGRHTARVVVAWGMSAAGAALVASWMPPGSAGRSAAISHLLLDTVVSQLVLLALDGGLADVVHLVGGNSSSSSSSKQQAGHIPEGGAGGPFGGGLPPFPHINAAALWEQASSSWGSGVGEDASPRAETM